MTFFLTLDEPRKHYWLQDAQPNMLCSQVHQPGTTSSSRRRNIIVHSNSIILIVVVLWPGADQPMWLEKTTNANEFQRSVAEWLVYIWLPSINKLFCK